MTLPGDSVNAEAAADKPKSLLKVPDSNNENDYGSATDDNDDGEDTQQ